MALNKVTTLPEAVSGLVRDGDTVSMGGILSREPVACAYELIRQGKKDLTMIVDSRDESVELLIGSGLVKKVESAYVWVGVIGSGLHFRRAVEKGIPRHIEVEDYSNLAIGMRFLAGALGVPYMPLRSMMGSDIPRHNPRVKITEDPYDGEKVALVPAARPDVAFIHVQRADKMGNAQIWGMIGNDINIARAAKKVILTCEEIVPTPEIRKIPNMTQIPFYCVEAVVELPFGAHPLGVAGYYWIDTPFRREWLAASKTYEGFRAWLDKWVFSWDSFDGYLRKLGEERLAGLREMEHDNFRIPKIESY
ncbi:MAG: CoA transferase subunit A [Bacillota bacterium]